MLDPARDTSNSEPEIDSRLPPLLNVPTIRAIDATSREEASHIHSLSGPSRHLRDPRSGEVGRTVTSPQLKSPSPFSYVQTQKFSIGLEPWPELTYHSRFMTKKRLATA